MFLPTVASTAGVNFLCCMVQSNKADGKVFPLHRIADFSDEKSVSAAIEYLSARGVDTYMALGAFKKDVNGKYTRTADNCVALRSLWLDIDAGAVKFSKHGNQVYRSRQDAADALMAFMTASGIAQPTYVVSSGEGLHVYWAFNRDLHVNEWLDMARRLRVACVQHGFKIDPGRTIDCASIMRLPGSTHSASGNRVELIYDGGVHEVAPMQEYLSQYATTSEPKIFDWLSDTPSFAGDPSVTGIQLTAETPKSMEKIIALERDERAGCAQLYWLFTHQNEVPEPLWRAGLSIAQHCIDRDVWVHRLSDQYENYSPDETEHKASSCKGPYTCETFEMLRPEGCVGCPHKARGVKSPIVLGINPTNVPQQVRVINHITKLEETLTVPSYPAPFFRKPTGGIWVIAKIKQTSPEGFVYEVEQERCVWPHDFYITERVAETSTQKYWCRHHSPRDGVVEFELSSDDVAAGGDTLWKALYGFGIPVQDDMRKYMSKYIQAMVKQRVETSKAREACHSMGWMDGDTFVLGDKEFTPAGMRPAPVSSSNMAAHFTKGMHVTYPADCADNPLAGWRNMLAEAYPNGNDTALAGQYIICAALGAPLCSRFALDDQRSGLINIYSDGTGHGKTLATAIACRIYGLPKTFTIKGRAQGATINSFFEMLGYVQALPLVRDEITEMSADELSDITYALVNGKTKIRMQGQNNDIREGEKYWGTYVFSTSNRSIVDSLINKKGDPTAQYSRVTEFEYPLPTWIVGDAGRERAVRVARRAEEFSGIAGSALINWAVCNYDIAKRMYEQVYDMLASRIEAPRNKARFWLNHATGVVLGAIVGEELGLHPFDSTAVADYAVSRIDLMWKRSESAVVTVDDALADLLASSIDQWLVISKDGAPLSTVHRDISVRVEQSSNRMWITQAAIIEYCKRRERNATTIINYIKQVGGINVKKRMLANTQYTAGSSSQRAWEIDLNNPEAVALMGIKGDEDDNSSL